MKILSKPTSKVLVRVLITVLLLLWVCRQVDVPSFLQAARRANWAWLGLVWTFTALFFVVQSKAMQLILHRQGCHVDLHTLFGTSAITALYGLVLPGLLSTGVKWYILKRRTGKGINVLSGMLYNQVVLTVVMFAIGLASLMVVNPTRILLPGAPRWLLPVICGFCLAVIALISSVAVNPRTGGQVLRPLTAILKLLPQVIRVKGQQVLTQIVHFQTAGWRFHGVVLLINVVNGALVGLLIYLSAASAARVTVPLATLVLLCAVVYTLGRLPISVANLGVREVTLVGLLGAYGVSESVALLMSMVLFSSLLFIALLGVAYQVAWGMGRPRDTP
jgi:hypothetical protein